MLIKTETKTDKIKKNDVCEAKYGVTKDTNSVLAAWKVRRQSKNECSALESCQQQCKVP